MPAYWPVCGTLKQRPELTVDADGSVGGAVVYAEGNFPDAPEHLFQALRIQKPSLIQAQCEFLRICFWLSRGRLPKLSVKTRQFMALPGWNPAGKQIFDLAFSAAGHRVSKTFSESGPHLIQGAVSITG